MRRKCSTASFAMSKFLRVLKVNRRENPHELHNGLVQGWQGSISLGRVSMKLVLMVCPGQMRREAFLPISFLHSWTHMNVWRKDTRKNTPALLITRFHLLLLLLIDWSIDSLPFSHITDILYTLIGVRDT